MSTRAVLDVRVGNSTYQAIRDTANPTSGWYFVDTATKAATRELPTGPMTPTDLMPPGADRTDPVTLAQYFDAFFLRDKPGVVLPRLMTGEERAARKRAQQAAPYLKYFPVGTHLKPVEMEAETALLGPSSWTHYSFGTPASESGLPSNAGLSNERLQAAVAAAVMQSEPDRDLIPGWDEQNDPVAWHGLLAQLRDYLAQLHTSEEHKKQRIALQQRLASAPDAMQALPAVRVALAELLAAGEPADGEYVRMLSSVLERFRPSSEGGGLGRPAVFPAPPSSSAPRPSVSFLAGTGGGTSSGSSSGMVTTGSPPPSDARGDEIALGRLVSAFTSAYNPSMGRHLLSHPAKLAGVMGGITTSRAWRQAIVAMLDSHGEEAGGARAVDDPFLQRFVLAAAGTGGGEEDVVMGGVSFRREDVARRAELACVPVLAGDVSFALQLACDCVTTACSEEGVGSHVGASSKFPDSARRGLAPAATTELATLLAADISAALATSLAARAVGGRDAGASAMQVEGGGGSGEATPLFAALRAGRVRQELSYSTLARPGPLCQSGLVALPADPRLLLDAGAITGVSSAGVGAGGAGPGGGPFESGQRLRRLSLEFWHSHRGRHEFFPEEGSESMDASTAAAAVMASSLIATRPDERPADTGSDLRDSSLAGQDIVGAELEDRACKAGAVRCLTREQAVAVCRSVSDLSSFFLDAASFEGYVAQRGQYRDALARGGLPAEEEAAYAQHVTSIDALLIGHSFALRLLRCVDVTVLLLHTLFHPGVHCDPDGASLAQGAALTSDALATAIAWGVSVAGAEGERRDRVALAYTDVSAGSGGGGGCALPYGDSALPTSLLTVPLPCGGAAYLLPASDGGGGSGEASSLDESTSVQLLARALGEAGRACKEDQPMRKAFGNAFGASATVAATAADEVLARCEAELLLRAAVHPVCALGLLHTLRHTLLAPGVFDDAKVLKLAPIYARMGLVVAERWPLLAPNALSLMRSCLQLSPPFVDAPALAPAREGFADLLAELCCNTGYIIPVLTFVQGAVVKGGVETPLARIFLSRVVERVASTLSPTAPPSLSLPAALAVVRLIDALQGKLAGLADATGGTVRRYEGALLPSPTLSLTVDILLGDVGRLLARSVTNAELVGDKTAGWSGEQRELARLLADVEGRKKREGRV